MRDIYKSLNLLFKSDELIDDLIYKFQHNQAVPNKYNDFYVENGDLIYRPLDLAIVRNADKHAVLKLWLETNTNLIAGRGVVTIYKDICTQLANITRKDVQDYLKTLPEHLIMTDKQYVRAKPIVEKIPNARYQVDLIDMTSFESPNRHYNYILNCVDVYSRYCWLRLLKKKEAVLVRDAMMDIIDSTGVQPNVIQTDNGTEFMGAFHEYLRNEHIGHIYNHSYSPNQNAMVERSNRDVRKIINSIFTINKNKVYYDRIQDVQDAKNNAYNSSIKCRAIDLWRPNKDIIVNRIIPKTLLTPADKHLIVAYENNEKAHKRMEQYKRTDDFNDEDYVLLKMSSIFSTMRKRIKAGESKLLPVIMAPILFRIRQVIRSRKPTTRNRYIVVNVDTNHAVCNPKGSFRYLTANDMIHCTNNDDFNMTIQQAIGLDGLKENNYDLRYE